MRVCTLVLLMLWMFMKDVRSAPRSRRELEQLSEESDFAASEGTEINSKNLNTEEFVVDKLPLNAGRQVKMDDYEILKKRNRILKSGNVDALVDMIEKEMEASKKWNKIEVSSFPSVEELHLVDNDLKIFKEMMNKVTFLEKQMSKPSDQHVAVKPFDKNLKIVKAQIVKLDDKLDSNTMNFVKEFLIRADKFAKESHERFHEVLSESHERFHEGLSSNFKGGEDLIDNLDELIKDRELQDNSKEEVKEDDASLARHYHPKFKYYWNREMEESHHHLHPGHGPTDKSDSVIKSSVSNSWFGWSLDMFALVFLLLILTGLVIGKLTLCRTKGSFHKVAKC